MSNKVTYKNYNMNQLQMPMDITDWIEENHISKLINQVVEGIDEKILRQSYKGGGRCSYHPKMMLKIIIYAYINKVTSGRKIEKLCKENLPMIWLAARQTPDFRTINRFRVEKKELIEEVLIFLKWRFKMGMRLLSLFLWKIILLEMIHRCHVI